MSMPRPEFTRCRACGGDSEAQALCRTCGGLGVTPVTPRWVRRLVAWLIVGFVLGVLLWAWRAYGAEPPAVTQDEIDRIDARENARRLRPDPYATVGDYLRPDGVHGDCKTYVVAKLCALNRAGVARGRMQAWSIMAPVRAHQLGGHTVYEREAHVVLIVDGRRVLDNLRPAPSDRSELQAHGYVFLGRASLIEAGAWRACPEDERKERR